jgi:hypothetical protein
MWCDQAGETLRDAGRREQAAEAREREIMLTEDYKSR